MLKFFSNLLSPYMVHFFTVIGIIIYFHNSLFQTFIVLSISLIFLIAIPFFPVLYFSMKGKTDLDVSRREDRTKFYIIAGFSYLVASILFTSASNHILSVLSFSYFIVAFVIMFFNLKTKISAHAAGIISSATPLFFIFGKITIPFYLLIIPTVYIRKKLGAHTNIQLIMGTFVSFIASYLVFLLIY